MGSQTGSLHRSGLENKNNLCTGLSTYWQIYDCFKVKVKKKCIRDYTRKTKDKIAIEYLHTSIINLKVNGLNSPTKWYRAAYWIKKKKTQLYAAFRKRISAARTNIDSK